MNSYKQAFYVGLIRILANIVMVSAVFVAMYVSVGPGAWPAEATFCAVFFGITIPAWALAFWMTRKVRGIFPAEAQSMVNLPGFGPSLVSWRVRRNALDIPLQPQEGKRFHGAPPHGVLWRAEAGASA